MSSSNRKGPVPGFGTLDEKVVRNTAGTLDFYYRFLPTNTPFGLSGIEIANYLPNTTFFQISLATAVDGPGSLPPDDGYLYYSGFFQNAEFNFPDNLMSAFAAPSSVVGPEDTKFLIVRTNGYAFDSGGFADITSRNFGGLFFATEVFVPVATPEPTSCALLLAGLSILTLRRRLY